MSVVCLVVPLKLAVRVTEVDCVTAEVVTVAVADALPAIMVTPAGTDATVEFDELNEMTRGTGNTALWVTVSTPFFPPEIGLRFTDSEVS